MFLVAYFNGLDGFLNAFDKCFLMVFPAKEMKNKTFFWGMAGSSSVLFSALVLTVKESNQ